MGSKGIDLGELLRRTFRARTMSWPEEEDESENDGGISTSFTFFFFLFFFSDNGFQCIASLFFAH